ncbi:MAG: FAD-dependent oxidoreductase [Prolixibacteraceae bacterium]|nr:FAD-dependent oxidoreductase [Prolixibacteraceae bacterium]
MKRRDFIKSATVVAGGLSLANFYGFSSIEKSANGQTWLISKRATGINILATVDVLVMGGSAAGVAAATAAAKSGASVFLVASEPYLGYDICGTLRLDDVGKGATTTFSEELHSSVGVPTPAYVKTVLQNQLIDNHVGFLMSSYTGGVILDGKDEIAGIMIANRSGEQLIRARTVIDATNTALVARLTGSELKPASEKTSKYMFRVVGNNVKPNIKHQVLSPLIFDEKEYPVTEYHVSPGKEVCSYGDLQEFEQSVRDKTWDPDQVDASDILWEISSKNIISENKERTAFDNAEFFPLSAFQLREQRRLFVLNTYADATFNSKEKMLLPGNMIALGLRLGAYLGEKSREWPLGEMSGILNREGKMKSSASGAVYNRPARPLHAKDVFEVDGEKIPVLGVFDNVVVGGGTAGACAAISSSRYGSKTLVVETLHGLGGMGTMGLIGRYWVGYREGFTKEIDGGVRNMAPAKNPRQKQKRSDWVNDSKMQWYRSEILKAGGEVWFGVIACGAVVDKNTVKGVVVSTPFGKGAIMAENVIDSTGSADIAIAAGANFEFVNADSVAVQGAGLPKVDPGDHYNNTDYTFIDDTDVFDVTRTFVLGNTKYKGVYDIGKLPQTRERRRMVGDYTVSALDMANGRHYDDTISYHYSSFDTHGFTIDPYFIIKPPADSSVDMYVNVPLRALLPKGLNNIIVTGLGASADRDAMPVIRMQPCLQNQGYSVGYLANLVQKQKISFRDIDFKKVRSELLRKGTLPEKNRHGKDNFPPSETRIREAINSLVNDYDKLEMVLWDKKRGLKLLKETYNETDNKQLKTKCASILGFYGHFDVCETLVEEASTYDDWDEGWDFRGMHQFGMSASYLDALLMSIGNTGNPKGFNQVKRLARKLSAKSELSHFRAIAEAFAGLKMKEAVPVLYRLLTMPGISGYVVDDFGDVLFSVNDDVNDNTTRNNSLRELFLARALFICGDHEKSGYNILTRYANDLRGPYSTHAMNVLNKYA